MSGLKTPAGYSRTSNGTKPKSRICRLKSSRSLIPSLVGNIPERTLEATESSSSSPSRSSTSPRKVACSDRKSPRRPSIEERQQAHHSPKRSPRKFLPPLDDDLFQDEMGLSFEVSSTTSTCVGERSGMSFLEFETLYTLEKEMLMQSRCNQDPMAQLNDKCMIAGWFGGRKGVYTELPDPLLCHHVCMCSAVAPVSSSQAPTEGFSFAPGWSLNADHFYQWQHRGKTTQQVVCN